MRFTVRFVPLGSLHDEETKYIRNRWENKQTESFGDFIIGTSSLVMEPINPALSILLSFPLKRFLKFGDNFIL